MISIDNAESRPVWAYIVVILGCISGLVLSSHYEKIAPERHLEIFAFYLGFSCLLAATCTLLALRIQAHPTFKVIMMTINKKIGKKR